MTHTTFAFRCAIAGLAVAVFSACGDSTEPYAEQAVEVNAKAVQMEVAPSAAFDVVATYLRGACVTIRRVIVRDSAGVRIGIRLKQVQRPKDVLCPDNLCNGTVSVRIDPKYTLPFSVRFDRGDRADTVLMVRRRP